MSKSQVDRFENEEMEFAGELKIEEEPKMVEELQAEREWRLVLKQMEAEIGAKMEVNGDFQVNVLMNETKKMWDDVEGMKERVRRFRTETEVLRNENRELRSRVQKLERADKEIKSTHTRFEKAFVGLSVSMRGSMRNVAASRCEKPLL